MQRLLLSVLALVLFVGCGAPEGPFDSVRWKEGTPQRNTVESRWTTVDDLQRRHDLVGMTRSQIVRLLGPSDSTAYFSDSDTVYWLGTERGVVAIDSEWLVLTLGSDDSVVEARVVTD